MSANLQHDDLQDEFQEAFDYSLPANTNNFNVAINEQQGVGTPLPQFVIQCMELFGLSRVPSIFSYTLLYAFTNFLCAAMMQTITLHYAFM